MAFVDWAQIFVKAGDGGRGCESFYTDKYHRHPSPDGGDGGKGGGIVLVADSHLRTLLDFKFRQHYQAAKGGPGGSKGKKGKNGQDCILKVPVGTMVRDFKTGFLIKDLVTEGQRVMVAGGGRGGIGNAHKKIPKSPLSGESRIIVLELKLIADVGLIGFPNAGKSTLISAISKVKSKIGNYHFTTKAPILGIVETDDGNLVVADLPGLIEGAHEGRGLGDKFLRHAERTKILVHVVDMGSSEGRDPLEDYAKINHELNAYSEDLMGKPKIVVANKMDLPEAARHLKRFKRKYQQKVCPVSALEKTGLEKLVEEITALLWSDNFPERLNALSLK